MEVILDGSRMTSREALHDHLQEMLNLPDYYGRNLDALYDALSESEQLVIKLVHADMLVHTLGNYGKAFLNTLADASLSYSNVEFSISNEII